MNILLWHVHGSWTTAFVHGAHDYAVPVLPGRGPDGLGRPTTYVWPKEVRELTPEEIRDEDWDLVVLQRPHELRAPAAEGGGAGLCEEWLGRRPGLDVPAVYVEHNAPQGRIGELRHPCADRPEVPVVHVTHFNALFWDCGEAPTHVVEHGIVDPGYRYTGELARVGVAINEPRRRGRVTGTDLLPSLCGEVPYDVFGMKAAEVGGIEDLPQDELHSELARRRVYLHPIRWTSLGLALLEAMHLGMPIVALATTEVPLAVPPEAGVISTRPAILRDAVSDLVADFDRAQEMGRAARKSVLAAYSLARFQADWDSLIAAHVGVAA